VYSRSYFSMVHVMENKLELPFACEAMLSYGFFFFKTLVGGNLPTMLSTWRSLMSNYDFVMLSFLMLSNLRTMF